MPTPDDPTAADLRFMGKLPGGPTVFRYGPASWSTPEASAHAADLLALPWEAQENCIFAVFGEGSPVVSIPASVVAVTNHPDVAAAIVALHNQKLQTGKE